MRALGIGGAFAALFGAMKEGPVLDAPRPGAPAPMRGMVRARRVRVSNFGGRKPQLSDREARAAAARQTQERRLREYRRDPIHCADRETEDRGLREAVRQGLRDRGWNVAGVAA